ncbi:restriction endonuclease [Ramlibacter rhizophilus]|uniref:Restriction endonuclease n=1 Tax=Ramlibacter rhizophilus TaxID=1781167 RepID=A0A4Z0BN56_9BURK|nr:restriction endonuclease [Ramlibacter rhizophilus]TFY99494.1 restriction endonuclease [Ramlibacter rhizophilus]
MKFRMAPNSLFAVLLRSPWWISIGLALVLLAISQALLPEQLRLVGAAGALPFVGLGLVALQRQWRLPSARQVDALAQRLSAMGWTEFSALLARGFERQGWSVEPAAGGVDLLLQRPGRKALVSAKRWKAARHGEDMLQALVKAMRERDASGGVYVALGELSPQAGSLAKRHSVQVLHAPELAQLLRGLPGSS